jgi:translation initiation factor 1 (eIF-1/SUI1)
MSKRFQRWVDIWIEENVIPGAHTDIESDEARVKRLMGQMFTEAAAAGFSKVEMDEERKGIPRQVMTAVTAGTEFDIDAYQLAWMLAMEHEDGD